MPSTSASITREKEYVRRIERRFLALRESGLILSSRDFEILHDWFERGVPAELVVQVLEEVFAKTADRPEGRRIGSIAYTRKAVERAWEERRVALLGGSPGSAPSAAAGFHEAQIAAHLASVAEGTRAAAENPGAPGEPGVDRATQAACEALREIAAHLEAMVVIPTPATGGGAPARDLPALEAELVALEERALAAARETLPAAELDAIETKTAADLSAASSRMSVKARDATLRRAVDAAVRRRAGLPRYSLFTMN